MNKKRERLFDEFPKIDTKEWENIILQDLKGADYAKRLLWKTDENITVKPYYRSEDLNELGYLNQDPNEFPFLRGTKEKGNDWRIAQRISETNPQKANAIALELISKGATALFLNAKEIKNSQDLAKLLDKIDLETIALRFENHFSYTQLTEWFLDYVNQQHIDKTKVTGSFDYDPITYLLLHNKFWKSKEEDLQEILYLQQNIGKQLPNFNYISSNGNILHNCGTTIVQELAYSLAIANEYIVFATEKGLSIDDIAPHIQFTFSIASNYFMEIAKLRVGRMLWASIVEAYNPSVAEAGKINCYSISSSWNKTMYDSNVNMLRATTEGMAAAIGGTDAILLAPFDETYKDADSFSQRLAKNIQVILKEEAHFDKVNDPAAGSYYIENLTHSMANEVWNLFLEIENTGGLIQSAIQGKIKEAVETSCQKRNMDIATRKIVLLGTNQYPNTNESMIDKISLKPIATYAGLQPYRGAIPFEELRLATENWAKKHGRPNVFLFKIGNLAMRQARAGFISNFFGCAGYEIIETPGYKTAEEGLKDVKDSNPHIVVICSSDEEYDTFAPEITEKIKSFNPSIRSVVAGNPVDSIEKLETAGIDDFIHVKLNVLETLRKYNKLLGIE